MKQTAIVRIDQSRMNVLAFGHIARSCARTVFNYQYSANVAVTDHHRELFPAQLLPTSHAHRR
jgi:hypothetical protein